MKKALVLLCLVVLVTLLGGGCASPTGNVIGHALLPGYTVGEAVQFEKESLTQEKRRETSALNVKYRATPEGQETLVGFDVATIWESFQSLGLPVIAPAALWDAVKAFGWYAIIHWLQGALSSDSGSENSQDELELDGEDVRFSSEDTTKVLLGPGTWDVKKVVEEEEVVQ